MESDSSTQCSQHPDTCPHLEPAHPCPRPLTDTFKIRFNFVIPQRRGSSNGLFPRRLTTKTLYVPLISPIRATCPAHLILLDLIPTARTLHLRAACDSQVKQR